MHVKVKLHKPKWQKYNWSNQKCNCIYCMKPPSLQKCVDMCRVWLWKAAFKLICWMGGKLFVLNLKLSLRSVRTNRIFWHHKQFGSITQVWRGKLQPAAHTLTMQRRHFVSHGLTFEMCIFIDSECLNIEDADVIVIFLSHELPKSLFQVLYGFKHACLSVTKHIWQS